MEDGRIKKIFCITGFFFAFVLLINPITGQAQPNDQRRGYDYGMGQGMMNGNNGMGYGMMGRGGWVNIPSKLPVPKSEEWVQKLKDILVTEKESLAQYESDQEKFNAYMPYMMVIPQEENHIDWIGQLFAAYGLSPEEKSFDVVQPKSLTEAYELGVKLETDLLPRYEWLVKNAEDRDSAQVLNTILLQSRWHLVMFEHVLRMGHGYGFSMGGGMMGGGYGMGQGMMWGSRGYDNEPRQYKSNSKPIVMKEAKAMMNDYLRSTRNPNIKLGKIKDVGNTFEAEILTRKNELVDKIIIDKQTGWLRSAY